MSWFRSSLQLQPVRPAINNLGMTLSTGDWDGRRSAGRPFASVRIFPGGGIERMPGWRGDFNADGGIRMAVEVPELSRAHGEPAAMDRGRSDGPFDPPARRTRDRRYLTIHPFASLVKRAVPRARGLCRSGGRLVARCPGVDQAQDWISSTSYTCHSP
jgi:hypothetical protein